MANDRDTLRAARLPIIEVARLNIVAVNYYPLIICEVEVMKKK